VRGAELNRLKQQDGKNIGHVRHRRAAPDLRAGALTSPWPTPLWRVKRRGCREPPPATTGSGPPGAPFALPRRVGRRARPHLPRSRVSVRAEPAVVPLSRAGSRQGSSATDGPRR
jgi:hypothetical protein